MRLVVRLLEAKIPLVPQIVAGAQGSEGGSSLVNVLLANLVSQNMLKSRL